MYGSAAGLLHASFTRNGVVADEIRGARAISSSAVFTRQPIEPHIDALRKAVLKGKYDAGLAGWRWSTGLAPLIATEASSILIRLRRQPGVALDRHAQSAG